MNPAIEILKQARGTVFVSEDGDEYPFTLLPPLTESELRTLAARIPCPLPEDVRDLLAFARGFDDVLESIDFSGLGGGFGMKEIFPCAVPIAHDGFGNYWVVDLTKNSTAWGPIFYACHDAPTIVYQTDSLAHFISEVLRFGNAPWKSEIDDVHEQWSNRVWSQNPGVLSHADCMASSDPDLKAFAQTLDESWQFVDLRAPKLGDGFSWGRYGPRTANKRFGDKRIFAYQKKSRGRRFLDALW